MMMHGGRMVRALCLLCLALLLPLQDVHSSKLLLQEKLGHGTGAATTHEPYREKGGSTGASNNNGHEQFDSVKWAEIHTDYIYTQDVKNP
ncbi:hypothetical protein GUJ93_ZPchr0012g20630 [Zizania palustris]|uniref:Phytosulfokine-beta n=1 Tax=Zizania palustris TaxID=103762 RepID=A0A8J5WR17_ZIZPA|nr:hypothetical protein GUJ93_ZPchr0012g20630 [Zizania palustris]